MKKEPTPIRVLILEDSHEDMLLILRELRRGGYEPEYERVETAEDFEFALESVGKDYWDLVISDYYMPMLRAPEALELARERDLDAPFIVVSGSIGEDIAVETMRAGANDYVMKDRLARLPSAVERELREAALRRRYARAEEHLRQMEERFRATFEQAAVGISHVGLDESWLMVNQKLCDILGYGREELMKTTFKDITYPEDLEEDLINMRALRAGEISDYSMEKRYVRKDGILVWVRLTVSAARDAGGAAEYLIAVTEDITERKRAEEDLERLASFPRLNPNLVIETNADGEPIYINPTALSRLPDLAELGPCHPMLAGILEIEREMRGSGGRPFEREVRCGERFYQQAISRVPEGDRLRVYATDTTERRRAEDALKASEELFRSLVQNSSDLILILDAEGIIRYESPAVETILGFGRGERIGINALDLIHPEDRERLRDVFSRYVTNPGLNPPVEYRVENAQGAFRNFEAIGNNLLHDPAIQGIVVNTRDVTERKRAEEERRKSQEQLQAILDNSTAVIYLKDTDGRYLLTNRRHEELFDVISESLVGKTDHDMFPKDTADKFRANDLEVLRSGVPLEIEETVPQDDGMHTYVSVKVPLRGSDGVPYAICGISTDITERKKAEEDLRRSEERFRALFEQSSLSVQILDPAGRTLRINRAWERLFGVTLDQLEDYNVFEDEQLVENGVMPYLLRGFAGEATDVPAIAYEPDRGDLVGRERWVRAFVYPVTDETGKITEVVIMHEDVTENREFEEALRQSEELYRTVIEQATEGIFLFDARTKRILETNIAFQKIFGYSSEELARMRVYDLIPHDSEGVDRNVERALEHGHLVVGERDYRRRDGSAIYVEVSGSVLSYDGNEVVCSVVRDITERKRAEEALRQSEELHRTVVEQAAENIFVVDVESKHILEANPSLGRSLGYTTEEIRELTLYDLVAHDRESVDLNIDRILTEGRYFVGEREYRRKDGSLVSVEVSVSAISYRGADALCVVAHDVTERKRAEEELRKVRDEERSRIARDLHDDVLQNLVYALQEIQITQITTDGDQQPPGLEAAAEALRRSVEGLRVAIFDLRLQTTMDRSFVTALQVLVELNRRMARNRYGIELHVEPGFPEDLPSEIGTNIVSVLQEALANARRHSGARNVHVSVGAEVGSVWAEVADDGRGFDPDAATGGMGTYSMRQRASEIGASLNLESAPGEGARVRLNVPLRDSPVNDEPEVEN